MVSYCSNQCLLLAWLEIAKKERSAAPWNCPASRPPTGSFHSRLNCLKITIVQRFSVKRAEVTTASIEKPLIRHNTCTYYLAHLNGGGKVDEAILSGNQTSQVVATSRLQTIWGYTEAVMAASCMSFISIQRSHASKWNRQNGMIAAQHNVSISIQRSGASASCCLKGVIFNPRVGMEWVAILSSHNLGNLQSKHPPEYSTDFSTVLENQHVFHDILSRFSVSRDGCCFSIKHGGRSFSKISDPIWHERRHWSVANQSSKWLHINAGLLRGNRFPHYHRG